MKASVPRVCSAACWAVMGLATVVTGASASPVKAADTAASAVSKDARQVAPVAPSKAATDLVKGGKASNKPSMSSETKPNTAQIKAPPKPKQPEDKALVQAPAK